MKKILWISSQGGHLNELLMLRKVIKKNDSLIVTEKTPSTQWLEEEYMVKYLPYGTKKNIFKYFFVFLANIILSFKNIIVFKPELVVTTGAHTCVPTVFIAKLFGKKVVYIESFANTENVSLTGKIVKNVVDKYVVQWEGVKDNICNMPKMKHKDRVEMWGSIY